MYKKIHSIKDDLITLARAIQSARGRREHHKFLLSGREQIDWAIETGISIEYILKREGDPLEGLSADNIYEVSEGILKKVTDTKYVVPLLGVAHMPKRKDCDSDLVVVLDNLVDFGNIGTIIRTAQAFGIRDFVATNEQFDPFQKKVIDASRGLVFQSGFSIYSDQSKAVQALKNKGYFIVATSSHAQKMLSQIELPTVPVALVVGNEADGVSDYIIKEADVTVQIPMLGIESLNVGVAAGISLYELRLKVVLLMLKEKIFSNLGRQIGVTGKLIQKAFDKKIKSTTGLTGMQAIALMIMHCDEKMTREEIARDVGLFDAKLDQFLEPLFIKGYIQSNGHFAVTEQGRLFLAQVWPVIEQAIEEILDGFSSDERKALFSYLERLQNNCSKMIMRDKND